MLGWTPHGADSRLAQIMVDADIAALEVGGERYIDVVSEWCDSSSPALPACSAETSSSVPAPPAPSSRSSP